MAAWICENTGALFCETELLHKWFKGLFNAHSISGPVVKGFFVVSVCCVSPPFTRNSIIIPSLTIMKAGWIPASLKPKDVIPFFWKSCQRRPRAVHSYTAGNNANSSLLFLIWIFVFDGWAVCEFFCCLLVLFFIWKRFLLVPLPPPLPRNRSMYSVIFCF